MQLIAGVHGVKLRLPPDPLSKDRSAKPKDNSDLEYRMRAIGFAIKEKKV